MRDPLVCAAAPGVRLAVHRQGNPDILHQPHHSAAEARGTIPITVSGLLSMEWSAPARIGRRRRLDGGGGRKEALSVAVNRGVGFG